MSGTTGASGDMYFSADGGVYDASGTMIGTYETDAAGNVDAVSSDTDGDGVLDTTVTDTDHNGTFETGVVDTDGDGYYDTMVVDTDGDGDFDTAAVDTDRDGQADTTAHDPARLLSRPRRMTVTLDADGGAGRCASTSPTGCAAGPAADPLHRGLAEVGSPARARRPPSTGPPRRVDREPTTTRPRPHGREHRRTGYLDRGRVLRRPGSWCTPGREPMTADTAAPTARRHPLTDEVLAWWPTPRAAVEDDEAAPPRRSTPTSPACRPGTPRWSSSGRRSAARARSSTR